MFDEIDQWGLVKHLVNSVKNVKNSVTELTGVGLTDWSIPSKR